MFPHSIHSIDRLTNSKTTHFDSKMCKIVKNVQISFILLLSVCVYVWKPAFKGLKTFTVLSFHFSVYLVGYGKNWVKSLYFLPN